MLNRDQLHQYLANRFPGSSIDNLIIKDLSQDLEEGDACKQFGYGQPLRLNYVVDGQSYCEVLHSVNRNGFGRERRADHVAAVWLDHETFNLLPGHAPVVDFVALSREG